ncbi:transient receptor potential cation channel subfamily M member-like 2 [Ptychodera flava]|uniref:transient receptor potential cation channel subfamily M member-like 2 n=1 Tax=Ptychodera flava TaxID=63121 RepID=UPI00396A67CB
MYRKRDSKVSPSDEESEVLSQGSVTGMPQSEELPLVKVKSEAEGKRDKPDTRRKRLGKGDNNSKQTGESSNMHRTAPRLHGNYGFFSDEVYFSSDSTIQEPAPLPGTSRSEVPKVSIQEPTQENKKAADMFYDVAQKVVTQERELKNERAREEAVYSISRNLHNLASSSQDVESARSNRDRTSSTSYHRRKTTLSPNDLLRDFVTNNMKQRKCRTFIEDSRWSSSDESIAMCCCGRSMSDHRGAVSKETGEWKVETCTVTEPANSFGQIEFVGYGQGKKRAPYARLDYKTNPETIWKLLTEHWRLKPPNVLISVTGGAKDFVLKDRLRALFHKGLMKAATSTGAWIISGGTAEGVMKVVGEAVHEEAKEHTHDDEKPVYALGIATWGIVDNKEALDGSRKHIKLWPATYPAEGLRSVKNSAALDCNHTHFILVDNGTIGKYGADIELRSALEKYIADEKFIAEKRVSDSLEAHCERVPMVLVVVEGGPNTLKTVYETTEKKMPAVIVEGSGRAADVIAYAYKKTKPSNTDSNISRNVDRDDIKQRVIKTFNLDPKDAKVEQFIDWVQACIRNRNLITVFRIQDADTRDIDGAILHALLQARSGSAQAQLNLALAWNRSDIARQEIFAPERRKEWQKIAMDEAMLTALTLDRVDFVQLLMDHGIVLKKFSPSRDSTNSITRSVLLE